MGGAQILSRRLTAHALFIADQNAWFGRTEPAKCARRPVQLVSQNAMTDGVRPGRPGVPVASVGGAGAGDELGGGNEPVGTFVLGERLSNGAPGVSLLVSTDNSSDLRSVGPSHHRSTDSRGRGQ